jgi:CRISPR-associated protein Csb2
VAHTRHYYPDTVHTRAVASTDRTLDAFAVFERDADLAVEWPFQLDPDQRAALTRLAGSIPYFGRADSVCFGSVPAGWAPDAHEVWVPQDVAETILDGPPATAVLAPQLPLQLDTLVARPLEVRRGGLVFPAGSRLVAYQRRSSPLRWATRTTRRPQSTVTAVRFAVLQAGLPPETDALVYTDLLRQAALYQLSGLREERQHTMLGGKSADQSPMTGHQHAHYLPLITDRRLSGLLVWAPGGLPEDEVKALTAVDRLYSTQNPNWRLRIRAAAVGEVPQVWPELAGRGARVWRSVTPFTPAYFPKRNQPPEVYLRQEVCRELANRGRPEPVEVSVLGEDWRPWRRYRPTARRRHDPGQGQATRLGAFLRLRFDQPQTTPIALGHLSHFGLGLFHPEQS